MRHNEEEGRREKRGDNKLKLVKHVKLLYNLTRIYLILLQEVLDHL